MALNNAGKNAAEEMRNWLKYPLYGCRFAMKLAYRGTDQPYSILIHEIVGPVDAEVVDTLNGLIDSAANDLKSVVLLFPNLRTCEDVAELTASFCATPRWTLSFPTWKHSPRDGILLGLSYATELGLPSKVMGFAPLGSMPVTRRAPYVGIALWAGGPMNPDHPREKAGKRAKFVSFADMPVPDDVRAAHQRLWSESETATNWLRAGPPEGAAELDVSFCLDARAAARFGVT